MSGSVFKPPDPSERQPTYDFSPRPFRPEQMKPRLN
jgi:hypothetical protein